jgi:hypothetical protein
MKKVDRGRVKQQNKKYEWSRVHEILEYLKTILNKETRKCFPKQQNKIKSTNS